MQLKVISWNIWCGIHLKGVLDFLKTADADIITLQEVIADDNGNTAVTIANELGYECVYAMGMQTPAKFMPEPLKKDEGFINFGNAILSRHTIIESKVHELSEQRSRLAIQADIQISDTILHAFGIHLKHSHQKPLELQDQQVENLIKVLPPQKAIVMGDFNALPKSNVIKKISKILQDTEINSSTPTWSVYREGCMVCLVDKIQYKLDYIFTSRDIKTGPFKVEQSRGSDHLPISAVIEI